MSFTLVGKTKQQCNTLDTLVYLADKLKNNKYVYKKLERILDRYCPNLFQTALVLTVNSINIGNHLFFKSLICS